LFNWEEELVVVECYTVLENYFLHVNNINFFGYSVKEVYHLLSKEDQSKRVVVKGDNFGDNLK
jgi:hypothetical protein